jgi:aspartate-semialdehyde dehydrogenase
VPSLRVAVVGATGAVGPEVLRVLEERAFPAADVAAFASARSAGRRVPFAAASSRCAS